MQGAPAEVMMKLRTPYELHVPNDATVSPYTEGVLGETFAEINVLGASGPPVQSGGVLKEKPTKLLTLEELIELIEKLADIVQWKPCAPQSKDMAATGVADSQQINRQMDRSH